MEKLFHVTRPILQPIKTSKTRGFLKFSRGREKDQWNEIVKRLVISHVIIELIEKFVQLKKEVTLTR